MKIVTWIKRVGVAMVLIGSAVAVVAPTSAAATEADGTVCSSTWHYIKLGEAGYLKPNAAGDAVVATGDRSADYWNQQVQFCRDADWTPGHYAVRMNANGRYWGWATTAYPVRPTDPQIYDVGNLFSFERYDTKFWTIRAVYGTAPYIYGDVNRGWALYGDRGSFLGGSNLFEITGDSNFLA